jgi:hypothetical protein
LSRPPKWGSPEITDRLDWRVWRRHVRTSPRSGVALGFALKAVRLVDWAVEVLLRVLFRSPTIVLHSSQGQPGDDEHARVRVPDSAFTLLGVDSGDQVLIRWCGRTSVAVALPGQDEFGDINYRPPAPTEEVTASGTDASSPAGNPVPFGLDQYLAPGNAGRRPVDSEQWARLSAPVRLQLGMPGVSAIEIRRRVRPQISRHLNQSLIPLAGVVLAATAFEPLRGWPAAVLAATVFLLSLSNIRIPRAPRGLWP